MVEPLIDTINPRSLISTPGKFFEIDLNTVTVEELDFCVSYEIVMNRKDKIHGVVAWFDIEFGNLDNPVRFSTGPRAKYTHWKSTVFYLDHDHKVTPGDRLSGNILC